MRVDQLTRFATVLDASVAKAAKASLAETVQKLRAVREQYAAMQSQIDHDFMNDITGLVEHLRKAERVTT